MEPFCSLLVLILTANVDTLLLAAGWTMGGRSLTKGAALVLSAVTSVMTGLSLWAGRCGGGLIAPETAKAVAGVLLVGLGLWVLLHSCGEESHFSGIRPDTMGDTLLLAGILAANNMGMGVAAGLAGMKPAAAGLMNFFASLLCLHLGAAVGGKGAGCVPCCWADKLSGGMLILLGIAAGWP